jgi:copper homeostasis protein
VKTPADFRPRLEICLDGVASARAAADGGADLVELCANLPEGGTTPSAGMIRAVRAAFTGGLMVIIRPRGGDFLYSADELAVMLHDIKLARDLGADGVVIGCLTHDGRVDAAMCGRLLEAAGPLDVTFHRAFDMTCDLNTALEDIIGLGIKRVLTSGGRPNVPAGTGKIAELVRQAAGRASIMPGGGVTEENLAAVIRATGAREIHLSARHAVPGRMEFRNASCFMGTFSKGHEYERREASVEKIQLARRALDEACAGG